MIRTEDEKTRKPIQDEIKALNMLLYEVDIKANSEYKYFSNEFAQLVDRFHKYIDDFSVERINQNNVWVGLLGKFSYSSGKWITDILIEKTNSSCIMIGVSQFDAFPKHGGFHTNSNKTAWMFYCNNGNKYSRGSYAGYYNRRVNAGEVVSVVVDMEKKELSFAVNHILCGKCYDVAFEKDEKKDLALAIDLHQTGDVVRILKPSIVFK